MTKTAKKKAEAAARMALLQNGLSTSAPAPAPTPVPTEPKKTKKQKKAEAAAREALLAAGSSNAAAVVTKTKKQRKAEAAAAREALLAAEPSNAAVVVAKTKKQRKAEAAAAREALASSQPSGTPASGVRTRSQRKAAEAAREALLRTQSSSDAPGGSKTEMQKEPKDPVSNALLATQSSSGAPVTTKTTMETVKTAEKVTLPSTETINEEHAITMPKEEATETMDGQALLFTEPSSDKLFERSLAFVEGTVKRKSEDGSIVQEKKDTPLLNQAGKNAIEASISGFCFPQLSLLGYIDTTKDVHTESDVASLASSVGSSSGFFDVSGGWRSPVASISPATIDPVVLNTDPPWSAFICGSQGSGKSHTLSCMLENCLYAQQDSRDTPIVHLPTPIGGILFHYDSSGHGQVCEAAYLATLGIKVRVLVSKTNFKTLKAAYQAIPKVGNSLDVQEFLLRPEDLNAGRLWELMCFSSENGTPLYIAKISALLRHMAETTKDGSMLDAARFKQFEKDIEMEDLTPGQRAPLDMRMSVLKSYMDVNQKQRLFEAEPGCLTIVDLSSPLIDRNDACSLFNIALQLFLESRSTCPRVVALDEAHKYMGTGDASDRFTEKILEMIRLQRHYGLRLIVSTQEPTVSPKLLDLCNMTFVHRFHSPDWFATLQSHLAALSRHGSDSDTARQNQRLFSKIMNLNTGEALLFAPMAVLPTHVDEQPLRLGMRTVNINIRARLSGDGGKSRRANV